MPRRKNTRLVVAKISTEIDLNRDLHMLVVYLSEMEWENGIRPRESVSNRWIVKDVFSPKPNERTIIPIVGIELHAQPYCVATTGFIHIYYCYSLPLFPSAHSTIYKPNRS